MKESVVIFSVKKEMLYSNYNGQMDCKYVLGKYGYDIHAEMFFVGKEHS